MGAEGDGAGEEDAEGEDEDDIVNNEEAALDFFAPETRMPRSDQTRRTLSVGSTIRPGWVKVTFGQRIHRFWD